MSRDHRRLKVFHEADELILAVYAGTAMFPREEREYLHFINIATGSAAETLYLLDLSHRLAFVTAEVYREFDRKYNRLLAGLQKLQHSLANDS